MMTPSLWLAKESRPELEAGKRAAQWADKAEDGIPTDIGM